jgi:membrane-associated protein
MELIANFIDFFIHLDRHLGALIQNFGGWTYLIIFLMIFCETGLVVTPLLPGDSLLFGLGAFAAVGALELKWLLMLLPVAAISGDLTNYSIGHFMGPKIFHREDVRFFKKEYLYRTQHFYEKYGRKTIVIARFIPIIRTFAPFVAGIGKMTFWRFIGFSIFGGILWINTFIWGGYLFGNVPLVKRNFTVVIFAIIIVSVLPGFIECFRHRKQAPL